MAKWCACSPSVPMTASANPLTKPATAAPRSGAPGLSMSMADVRGFAGLLERLGHSLEALLAAIGLRLADLNDPDRRVPCEAAGAMMAYAQRERFTPNIALAIAEATPIGAYPLLDYLVLSSDTVGAGLAQLARYLRVTGSPVDVAIQADRDPIRVELRSPSTFAIEHNASLIVLHMRRETDGRFAAAGVSFQHQPDDAAAYQHALGCPVRVGADWSGVSIDREIWELPLRRRDPTLRAFLEEQADAVLARLPARTGLASDVQRVLASRVAAGETRMSAVARQLGVSERTLQRRLAAEGVSYQELLDEARKAAAARYLTESSLAIGEIAYLLGYSEPAPFHRAFKRWYGVTPDAFRRSRRTRQALNLSGPK
jgi:AraC-like DNA-binding protein